MLRARVGEFLERRVERRDAWMPKQAEPDASEAGRRVSLSERNSPDRARRSIDAVVKMVGGGGSEEHQLHDAPVHAGQGYDVLDVHVFVDLVDRCIDRPKLNHVGACRRNETAIRRATTR